MQDLRLPQIARRITGWTNVIVLGGLAMLGIVMADDNHWAACALAYLVFSLMLYFLGTASYRLSVKDNGRIEAHSLLGLKLLDLRNGFTVKRAPFSPGIVVLHAGKKRARLYRALGGSATIEDWLQDASHSGSTVAGRG